MKAAEIRQKFLDYFEHHNHQRVLSSPLVPAEDPTLLFTNAGMVQFKDVFLGMESRTYRRAVSVQKCMRAGGKHNDLDQVGRTARHLTLFEMLGNFSFGDYFKKEAIALAWNFLTQVLGISQDKLWVTIFETDEEAFEIWKDVLNGQTDRIVRMGEKDNFWSMGDTGPCGPCSEIFVDRGEKYACGPHCGLGQCECDRIQEIWNLVFMQYDRAQDGTMTPLPRPSIDTGMGLERISAYLQGVDSNFETDLLRPLIAEVERMSGKTYESGPQGMPFRVISDHARAITFLLAEGVSFSNLGRGYVMRRILRRAMRFGLLIGFDRPFLNQLVSKVGEIMGAAYPEVVSGKNVIQQLIAQEEERFLVNLNSGMKVLNEKFSMIPDGGQLSGQDAFQLYDTYGFPLDLTQDAAAERGLSVDYDGFSKAMDLQRQRARESRGESIAAVLPRIGPVEFTGYDTLAEDAVAIGAIYIGEDGVERLEAGQSGWIWISKTPFYPEGGGQVADTGFLETDKCRAVVENVQKKNGEIWHYVSVDHGVLYLGDVARLTVSEASRLGAMRNHTATHLLHAALRDILGDGVHQTGSLVSPDRLRFDFSAARALTPEEIFAIERQVNSWVLDNRPITVELMSQIDARDKGALAFFGEKYGETVRVVSVPHASSELCGGTHCRATGQIGLFAIVSEMSVGSGSRRIEAITGMAAMERFQRMRDVVSALENVVKATSVEQIHTRVQDAFAENKELRARLADVERNKFEEYGRQLASDRRRMVGETSWVAAQVEACDMEELRSIVDGLKGSIDAAVLLASHESRVSLIVYIGEKLRGDGLKARDVVKRLAPLIDGGGGGRDDLAQAGGKSGEKIPELIALADKIFEGRVGVAG